MRNNTSIEGLTDYEKKFGSGDLSDLYMAFKSGFTLTEPERGTWDTWLYDLPFNWELWTSPRATETRGASPCMWITTL